jgi:hypothetical protein
MLVVRLTLEQFGLLVSAAAGFVARGHTMSTRLFLTAAVATFIFTGCAPHREYVWHKGGAGDRDRDRDLAAARAEAMKAYPNVGKLKKAPKNPRKAEEQLGEMRRSVQALYMASHGWHLVYFDSQGRMLPAEHGAH